MFNSVCVIIKSSYELVEENFLTNELFSKYLYSQRLVHFYVESLIEEYTSDEESTLKNIKTFYETIQYVFNENHLLLDYNSCFVIPGIPTRMEYNICINTNNEKTTFNNDPHLRSYAHPINTVHQLINTHTHIYHSPNVHGIFTNFGDRDSDLMTTCSEHLMYGKTKYTPTKHECCLYAGSLDHLHVGHLYIFTCLFLRFRALCIVLTADELLSLKAESANLSTAQFQPLSMRYLNVVYFTVLFNQSIMEDCVIGFDITHDSLGPAAWMNFKFLAYTDETLLGFNMVKKAKPNILGYKIPLLKSKSSVKISSSHIRKFELIQLNPEYYDIYNNILFPIVRTSLPIAIAMDLLVRNKWCKYHNINHICHFIQYLSKYVNFYEDSKYAYIVLIAIVFHDVIYDPNSKTNETDSLNFIKYLFTIIRNTTHVDRRVLASFADHPHYKFITDYNVKTKLSKIVEEDEDIISIASLFIRQSADHFKYLEMTKPIDPILSENANIFHLSKQWLLGDLAILKDTDKYPYYLQGILAEYCHYFPSFNSLISARRSILSELIKKASHILNEDYGLLKNELLFWEEEQVVDVMTSYKKTTGGHIWPCARRLLYWFQEQQQQQPSENQQNCQNTMPLIANPNVTLVELGGGTGWLSLNLLKTGICFNTHPIFTLTDHPLGVLPNKIIYTDYAIDETVIRNLRNVIPHVHLDWCQSPLIRHSFDLLRESNIDSPIVFFGSDLLYEEESVRGLLEFLSNFEFNSFIYAHTMRRFDFLDLIFFTDTCNFTYYIWKNDLWQLYTYELNSDGCEVDGNLFPDKQIEIFKICRKFMA